MTKWQSALKRLFLRLGAVFGVALYLSTVLCLFFCLLWPNFGPSRYLFNFTHNGWYPLFETIFEPLLFLIPGLLVGSAISPKTSLRFVHYSHFFLIILGLLVSAAFSYVIIEFFGEQARATTIGLVVYYMTTAVTISVVHWRQTRNWNRMHASGSTTATRAASTVESITNEQAIPKFGYFRMAPAFRTHFAIWVTIGLLGYWNWTTSATAVIIRTGGAIYTFRRGTVGEKAVVRLDNNSLVNDIWLEEHRKKLLHLPNLNLNLSNTSISDKGLVALRGMHNLRELLIAGTKVTDAGMAEIASLPELRLLNIRNTAVTDSGIESLANHEKLNAVLVDATALTTRSVVALKRNESLTSLTAYQATDETVALCADWPQLSFLYLSNRNTLLSNESIDLLSKMTDLDTLTVSLNNNQKQLLQQALPNCNIVVAWPIVEEMN